MTLDIKQFYPYSSKTENRRSESPSYGVDVYFPLNMDFSKWMGLVVTQFEDFGRQTDPNWRQKKGVYWNSRNTNEFLNLVRVFFDQRDLAEKFVSLIENKIIPIGNPQVREDTNFHYFQSHIPIRTDELTGLTFYSKDCVLAKRQKTMAARAIPPPRARSARIELSKVICHEKME